MRASVKSSSRCTLPSRVVVGKASLRDMVRLRAWCYSVDVTAGGPLTLWGTQQRLARCETGYIHANDREPRSSEPESKTHRGACQGGESVCFSTLLHGERWIPLYCVWSMKVPEFEACFGKQGKLGLLVECQNRQFDQEANGGTSNKDFSVGPRFLCCHPSHVMQSMDDTGKQL